jgi:hypothetical protein
VTGEEYGLGELIEIVFKGLTRLPRDESEERAYLPVAPASCSTIADASQRSRQVRVGSVSRGTDMTSRYSRDVDRTKRRNYRRRSSNY